ncbi:pleckstrin homology domain-containing family G member 5-like isoform X2 [Haliotis rufescens]|uniref:pleckstrin homology domain-containing family G member 5-like isoform X2 n=1 Tax=Haliotis rufescens TaxID=6454 RepID=UPI00201F3DF7|nr:pleckstrin homology domain-containing family G member 5-like isoform X2 [Haliotis rufescens]
MMKLRKKKFPRSFQKKKNKKIEDPENPTSPTSPTSPTTPLTPLSPTTPPVFSPAIASPTADSGFFDQPSSRDAENFDSAASVSPLSPSSPTWASPNNTPGTDDSDQDITQLFAEILKQVEENNSTSRFEFDRMSLDTISSRSVTPDPDLESLAELCPGRLGESFNEKINTTDDRDIVPALKKGENTLPCGCDRECLSTVEVKHVEIKAGYDGGAETCFVISTSTIQVCHHPQCTEENQDRPLLLCHQCDLDIHKKPEFTGHLVLDAPKRRKPILSHISSPESGNHSNSEAGEESEGDEDTVDGIYIKNTEKAKRSRSPSDIERRLKRKKAVKKKSIVKNDGFIRHSQSLDSGLNMANSPEHDSESRDASEGLKEDGVLEDINGDPGLPPSGRVPLRQQSRLPSVDDYFTLRFADNIDGEDVEVVAAVKNVTLQETLHPILERRNLDCSKVDVFVADSKTPLPINCDTFNLAGSTLHIKSSDRKKDSDSAVSRSASSSRPSSASKSTSTKGTKSAGGSLRSRRGNINLSIDETFSVPSTSPQGTLTFSEGRKLSKTPNKLANLFAPLNKDREKLEQLNEILSGYSQNGLPPPPPLLELGKEPIKEEAYVLESHWSAIVDHASQLSKRQHDQQEAIWELLQTELSYLSQIRVITEVFQACLLNVQSDSLLNEIETEKMFNNIDALLAVNRQLWEHHLLKVLEESRRTREPFNPTLLKPGFTKEFSKLLQPYTQYCMEQKACVDYMKAKHNENDLFKVFVMWAEAQKKCNRLKLTDLLVKPMQRLTKYSLLLQAILRKTENERQRRDLLEMIGKVDEFVTHVNTSMRDQVDKERMEAIVTKIEPYDAVEAPNDECVKLVQSYNSNFDLRSPMPGFSSCHSRALLMHSALKMKEAQARMDVDCFLFTDLLLVCKANKRMDKFKITKPPMRLDRIIVQDLKDKGSFLLIYLNEYHTPISAFTFHGDQTGVKVWLDHIKRAQETYSETLMKDQQKAQSKVSQVKEEVIYTPLSPLPKPDLISMERSGSIESAEGNFVPNLTTQNYASPSSPKKPNGIAAHLSLQDVGRTGSMGTLVNHTSPKSSELATSSSSPDSSPVTKKKHRPVSTCLSVPNIMDGRQDLQISPSLNSVSRDDSNIDDLKEEDSKEKRNPRRVSRNEKRYYTVDSVQELQKNKDRDNSIHKRLSWNLGSKELGCKDLRLEERNLQDPLHASDSLRSIPSSSGFSSSGSLHLNPESEISEETYIHTSDHDVSMLSIERDDMPAELTPETKNFKSKSTSDIMALMQDLKTSDQEGGITSVELPMVDSNKKKLSHAQILRMKKMHLLLNSNVEASEV